MDKFTDWVFAADPQLSSGLLGASVPASAGPYALEEERLLTIERRIIRLEMAMRQAGFDPELVCMPSTEGE